MNAPELRTVLITGAASGLGRACADSFLAAGWNVIGWDVTAGDVDGVASTVVDVRDWDRIHALAEGLPPLQAALNCAGVGSREPATALSREEWDHVISINLNGCFYVAHAVYPRLRAGGGTLVNFASINATVGFYNRSVYSAAKAALLALTRNLAVEWAPEVRVIAISPTFTWSPLFKQGVDEGKTDLAQILERTPQHRVLDPSEIGAAVLALVGPSFACVTGSEVLLDAGFAAHGGL